MNTCPKCGAEIEGVFCPECGYKIVPKTNQSQANADSSHAQADNQTIPYSTNKANVKSGKGKTLAIVAIACGVLLLVGAVVVLGNSSKEEIKENEVAVNDSGNEVKEIDSNSESQLSEQVQNNTADQNTDNNVESDTIGDSQEDVVSDSVNNEEQDTVIRDADDVGVHTYSLVVENSTWDEAYVRCINMGGHLARITSDEEWQAILRQIQSEGKDKIKFWIGAKRDDDSREYHWVYGEDMKYGDEIINTDSKYSGYWLDGEPSFYDESTSSYEDRVNIFYVKRANGWIWNDVPNDVSWIEFYNGSMGYICEFD